MNYIGSKYSLLPFIGSVIEDLIGVDLSNVVLCDIFAGTGAVGRYFKSKVQKVISNDWEYYSYVLNRNYIGNHTEISDKERYIEELNSLPSVSDGFIYNNYCSGSGSGRQYFSDENGKKIDAMRNQIEIWKMEGAISEDLYYFLLASLLESADKVANTAAVYGAFLKHIKATASKQIVLEPSLYTLNSNTHEVYREDANELISNIEGDVLYLDPPYNSRQYGANYHLLNTIAEYKPFIPKGKTGMRDYMRSSYCSKRTVIASFEALVREARFKYIVLSYNNEGLMPFDVIRTLMSKYGIYDVVSQEHQRFRADRQENRSFLSDKTTEYLHIIEKH